MHIAWWEIAIGIVGWVVGCIVCNWLYNKYKGGGN